MALLALLLQEAGCGVSGIAPPGSLPPRRGRGLLFGRSWGSGCLTTAGLGQEQGLRLRLHPKERHRVLRLRAASCQGAGRAPRSQQQQQQLHQRPPIRLSFAAVWNPTPPVLPAVSLRGLGRRDLDDQLWWWVGWRFCQRQSLRRPASRSQWVLLLLESASRLLLRVLCCCTQTSLICSKCDET